MVKDKLLLHACCAPCAGYVIEKLRQDYDLAIYYYNPNIYPKEEYYRRRNELINYCSKLNLPFFEEPYNYLEWENSIKGLEQEPERGRRCNQCFRLRLERAANYAESNGYDCLTTTLTISPHKISSNIIAIGKEASSKYNIKFLSEDFKKRDGYQLSTSISKRENFFRQTYCGCHYSM
ncbi:MAG: hypothetical protein APF84_18075 [Gracilibacter sp. BRH_c7a]|nr:MAG: hypothetical protein APF84_18075 [Gracilibacter sp. BRH_c7a]